MSLISLVETKFRSFLGKSANHKKRSELSSFHISFSHVSELIRTPVDVTSHRKLVPASLFCGNLSDTFIKPS